MEYTENNVNDDCLDMICYGMEKQIINELLEKKLISENEYYQIDDLNRKSFRQIINRVNK